MPKNLGKSAFQIRQTFYRFLTRCITNTTTTTSTPIVKTESTAQMEGMPTLSDNQPLTTDKLSLSQTDSSQEETSTNNNIA